LLALDEEEGRSESHPGEATPAVQPEQAKPSEWSPPFTSFPRVFGKPNQSCYSVGSDPRRKGCNPIPNQ
jgi:hypothetical protein